MTTKQFTDTDRPPQAALSKIFNYFQRVGRPIYMGWISLEIGYSLSQTQAMLDYLEERGFVRQITDDEKRGRFDVRGHIYAVVRMQHEGFDSL